MDFEYFKILVGKAMRLQQIGLAVISRVMTPLNFTLIFLTFLKTYKVTIPLPLMLLLFTSIFFGVFLLGLLYDTLGFWRTEMTFDGQRNNVLQEILREVKK